MTSKLDHPDTMWMTVPNPGDLESADDARAWCADTFVGLSEEQCANACGPLELRSP